MANPYGSRLFDHHAQLLADSAVSVEVAEARGYVTVDTKARLAETGIAKAARTVPGLLIPIRDVTGEIKLYQYRPDTPRLNEAGKPIKYETSAGRGLVIDVPPPVRDRLGDPSTPLWITEGARKADAAVSAGLCCVSLLGVYGWRGSNGQGGTTALACWESIALNGRDVFVAFDSDVMTKKEVTTACARLSQFLTSRGAKVQLVHLPDADGAKVGLDDYLAGGATVEQLHGLARPWNAKPDGTQQQPLAASAVTPTPGVDGSMLLEDVRSYLTRFVAFPSAHAAVAVTLWAAHTHLAGCFDSTPRLALLSAEKQSGKSRTLEILELLCVGAEYLSDTSAPFMFRRIAAGAVTVLLDECDAIWKRSKSDESAEALRSIVNQGHRKRGTIGRVEMVGKTAELARFRVYAPVALAGIGDCLPDTILDRAVIVRMRRRAPDEHIDQYRERTCRPEGEELAERLAGWAAQVAGKVGFPWPDMPQGVTDRPADVWEPLLAVAEAAGGDWPKLAREACVWFVKGARDDTASIGVRLLADLREIFGDRDVKSTDAILTGLHGIDEAPWADWRGKPFNARALAKMLKPYGIESTKVKIAGSSVRGYRREDLHDAWSRYLPNLSGTSGTSGTSLASTVPEVPEVPLPFPREEQLPWPDSESSPSASSANAPSDPATSAPGSSSTTDASSPAADASRTATTKSMHDSGRASGLDAGERPKRVKVGLSNGKAIIPEGALYIGRAGYGLPESEFANPHRVGTGGKKPKPCQDPGCAGLVHTREEALKLFERDVLPHLIEHARAELPKWAALACWCPLDLACHGDLLIEALGQGSTDET